jgi:hypothetical protein
VPPVPPAPAPPDGDVELLAVVDAAAGVVAPLVPMLGAAALELLVVVELLDELFVGGALAGAEVGTVKEGAPAVFVLPAPPLPQADSPRIARTVPVMATVLFARKIISTGGSSAVERRHASPAVRTVVEVLLRVLVTPVTEAQVVHGPRQIRGGRRERQQLADDLQRLTRLAV